MRLYRLTHRPVGKVGEILKNAVLSREIGAEIAGFLHLAVFKSKIMGGRQLVYVLEKGLLGR